MKSMFHGLGLVLLWLLMSAGTAHALDPRCGDRQATGVIVCTITQPVVYQHETVYPSVAFAPGDKVDVTADGCVQTGGTGATWKRYVNPTGPDSYRYYHGMIRIPTASPGGDSLQWISKVIGRQQTVNGVGVPLSQLVLHLGYIDDDYSDNGYWGHDDGTDDQCKTSGRNDGGPAHVTLTIYRGVGPAPPTSRFDFDVLSDAVDVNGLPLNPLWSWQKSNPGQIPQTSLCHEFSKRDTVAGIPSPVLAPNFPDCTDQADPSTVDLPQGTNGEICRTGGIFISNSFAGHVNWFPVTIEGRAAYGDHGADDDYTFSFTSDAPGDPLLVNNRNVLHVEFDSEETVAHFNTEEWAAFRDDANHGDGRVARNLFDGHAILTGMFGLDGEHNLKSELHPLFALATLRDDFKNGADDEDWLMFARNVGDEGFCSSQRWDAGFEDYTVRLPWRPGATGVDVNWGASKFEGTDGTSGPTVSQRLPPDPLAGVYVTFHLGPSSGSPWINGNLHLVWTVPSSARHRGLRSGLVANDGLGRWKSVSKLPGRVESSGEGEDEAEHRIAAAMAGLDPSVRARITAARASLSRPVATHSLAPSGTIRTISAPPPIVRRVRPRAIRLGPATEKLARDAAQIQALCAATGNRPSGLPQSACGVVTRDHRSPVRGPAS